MADYDLAIIGGGLNGASMARDAAGRGLRVILLEQGDLGAAASSATPRMIHGDLSVLERRGFLRVRTALAERNTWLKIAPHLVRPMRFAIPAHSGERPPWLLRSALLLYDRLASQPGLPASATQLNQIIVRRLFETDNVYVFQHSDRRLIFASPYERDFTLIGTASRAFRGDPAIVAMDASDIAYLCDAANRYFRERVEPSDVIRTVSGANLSLQPADRDGSITFDARRRKAPLVTMLGGDVTTARLRAERAVSHLTPFYAMSPQWTAKAPLPGGDFAWDKFDKEVDGARERWRFLTEPQAQRLVGAYGSRLADVLGDARDRIDLGPGFGPELTGAEVRYLMSHEWARFPDDILWRRSKLGLTLPSQDKEALAAFMAASR